MLLFPVSASLVAPARQPSVNKQVIVTFRGSKGPLSNRDWATNINCFIKKLWTPDKIVHRMEGRLKKRLLVHRGFYNYLFDNRFEKGNQPYDKLIRDLRLVLKDQEGYSVYVTGHRYDDAGVVVSKQPQRKACARAPVSPSGPGFGRSVSPECCDFFVFFPFRRSPGPASFGYPRYSVS